MRYILYISFIIVIASCSLVTKIENRKYSVHKTLSEQIEIRHYPAAVLAKVEVTGNRKQATNAGFKKLANYIFGNDIKMTAPVTTESVTDAFVTNSIDDNLEITDTWLVTFTMPANYTMGNLPTPPNKEVTLVTTKPQDVIVLKFSGSSSNNNLLEHYHKLKQYTQSKNIAVALKPIFAFYDNPWTTLPFLRHNEVMFILK
jgi:effector-binding domain-containing protein